MAASGGSGGTGWNVFAKVSDVSGFVAVALSAASVGAGAVGSWWLAAGVGVAIVPVGLVILRVKNPSIRPWLVIALCVVLASGIVGFTVDRQVLQDEKSDLASVASRLTIDYPQRDDKVPRCITPAGSGDIPSGMNIWVLITDPAGGYWAATKAEASHQGVWKSTDSMSIGDPGDLSVGHVFHLHFVLVDASLDDYLEDAGVELKGFPRDAFHSGNLPPGIEFASFNVERADDDAC